jgi:hypothetical protein
MRSIIRLPEPPPEVPRLSAIEHLAPRFAEKVLAVCDILRAHVWQEVGAI